MSSRKIRNDGQWVQIGGTVDSVLLITQSNYDALSSKDPSMMYVITDSTGASLTAQSFRVNQRIVQKIMVGENQLWQPVIFATGGTVTDIDVGGVMWRVHTFTSSGQLEVLQDNLSIEYLVVGGGGGGGVPSGYSGGGGGGFLVRWLSENKDKKVGKVVLVAPWLNPENNPVSDTADFFVFDIDPELVSRTAGVTIFNSDNDQETIHKSVQIIRDAIKDIGYKEFHNKGHFCYEDLKTVEFPELVEECLQ